MEEQQEQQAQDSQENWLGEGYHPVQEVIANGIMVGFYGTFCPVQAEGTIDGFRFYFRARGSRWSLSIAPPGPVHPANVGLLVPDEIGRVASGEITWEEGEQHPGFFHDEYWGEWPTAGWMSNQDAIACIISGAERFRLERERLREEDGPSSIWW